MAATRMALAEESCALKELIDAHVIEVPMSHVLGEKGVQEVRESWRRAAKAGVAELFASCIRLPVGADLTAHVEQFRAMREALSKK